MTRQTWCWWNLIATWVFHCASSISEAYYIIQNSHCGVFWETVSKQGTGLGSSVQQSQTSRRRGCSEGVQTGAHGWMNVVVGAVCWEVTRALLGRCSRAKHQRNAATICSRGAQSRQAERISLSKASAFQLSASRFCLIQVWHLLLNLFCWVTEWVQRLEIKLQSHEEQLLVKLWAQLTH